MAFSAALAAVFLMVSVASDGRAAAAGGRVALVVGVAGYKGFPLRNSVNDAALVADALKKQGFQVKLLDDPTRAQFTSAVTAFSKSARTADAAVLYFSGHGMEAEGVNYVLPQDAVFAADALVATTLPASKLREGVSSAQAVRLVILDACRNNPLGGAGGGLARESAGSSSEVVTIMAAAPGEVASDGDTAGNGPFAVALASALSRPGMTVGELPRYVQTEVQRLTGQKQTPDLQGIWREVGWSFSPAPAGGGSADDRRKAELAFWEGVRDSNDPDDFRGYLAEVDAGRFSGLFRSLAFKRLEKLGAAPVQVAAAKPLSTTPIPPKPVGSPMDRARVALARADYATAVAEWRAAAAAGDAAAMSNLGLAMVNGYAGAPDMAAAADWFRKSAERRNAAGMTNYAALLLNGAGVKKDEKAGLSWLRRAAEAGSPSAMEALGEIYARGERTPKDPVQAASWMKRAVDAGDGPALTDLAYWYEGGLNVPRDTARAIELYNRAALAGRGAAMVRLGGFYEAGDLLRQDLVQAATWYQRGVEVGDREAMRRLGGLYETGRGVRADRSAAIGYYRRAAQAGDGPARDALARLGVAG